MPYIRSGTLFLIFIMALLTVSLPANHPYYTLESMLLAVLFATLVHLMSLTGEFVMDLMAAIFTGFVTQRVIMTCLNPASLDYANYLTYSPDNFSAALTFLVFCSAAVLCGYLAARLISVSRQPIRHQSMKLDGIRIFGIMVPLDAIFRIFAYIAISLMLLRLYLMIFLGVGLRGVDFGREYAVLFRISNFFTGLTFLPFIMILKHDTDEKTRKLAYATLFLLLAVGLINTSKGLILYFLINFVISHYMVRGYLPKKYVKLAFAGLLATTMLYAPVITLGRIFGIQYVLTGSVSEALGKVSFSEVFRISEQSFNFLQRMGVYDWLLGSINIGRESFPWWASLQGDLLLVLKTLFPGDALMFIDDFVEVGTLIPEMMRGFNMEYHKGHAELLGGAAMAYDYFGYAGGVLFFFAWSFLINLIYKSNMHVVYKVLLIYHFMILVFIGSGFVTPICRTYEAYIILGLCLMLYLLRRFFVRIAMTQRLNIGKAN